MKKRILLTAVFVMILSLLAVFSVSAEEYTVVDNLGDPSWYTGNYELITDKTSKVVLSNGDGSYTAYPSYYILKYEITVQDGKVTKAYISNFDYSFVNEKTGKNYEAGAVYKIEIPNGITQIDKDLFGDHDGSIKETNVTEIVMSDTVTSLTGYVFRKAVNLKKVVFSKNLTTMGGYAFLEASALEEVVFPAGSDATLDMSGNEIFKGCSKLKSIDLSTRNVNSLGSHCFNGCTSLGKVTLSDTIESFGGQCFYMCENMYFASDFLPTNLKSVGFHFMTGAKHANSVLYFPEGFSAISTSHAFAEGKYYNENGLTLVFLGRMTEINLSQYRQTSSGKLKLILTKNDFSDLNGQIVTSVERDGNLGYIAKVPSGSAIVTKENGSLTISMCDSNFPHSDTKWETDADGNTLYHINTSAYEIYFCNGDDVELCYGIRSNNIDGKLNKAITTPVTFHKDAHNEAGIHYDITKVESIVNCGYDGVTSHTCVVCDRVENDIVPATGNHELTNVNACVDKCSVCLKYVQKEVQNHKIKESIAYANGYGEDGVYTQKCQNEGCSHEVSVDAPKLINFIGYSMPEYGGVGFVMTFQANKKAISEYKRVENVSVNYGIFAVANEKLGTNDILKADGSANDSVVKAEISLDYDAFDFRLSGFETDTQKSALLCIGTYVINSNNEISYIQTEEVSEGNKYAYISYNSVKTAVDSQQ